MMKIFSLIFVLSVVSAQKTTVQILAGDSRFSTLVNLVTKAGLVDILNAGTYTIFAPTNDAFAAVPNATFTALQNNVTLLSDVLLYHVAGGSIRSSVVTNELLKTMASGKIARFNVYSHNNKVTIQGAVISQFDLTASNGIIHVLDSVMMEPTKDIVGYVAGNPELSTLLSCVQKAGLTSALQKDGLTLFAPTNAAFNNLTAQQLVNVGKETAKLVSVLTRHVVNSTEFSAGLYRREHIQTLNTQETLSVHIFQHHNIKIGNGFVTTADIGVSNGVVHLIDHVLIPKHDPIFLG